MRVPASYQGLWGLRTTHGLVPRQGLLPLAQSFDTIGWLTRDGETLQRVVDWCLSYDGSESTENVYGESDDDLPWRFVVPTEVLDAVEPETRAAFDAFLDAARPRRRMPHRVESRVRSAISTSTSCRSAPCRAPRRGATTASGSARTRMRSAPPWRTGSAIASEVSADDEASARRALEPLAERVHALVADAVLLMPTVPGPAPMRTAVGERVERRARRDAADDDPGRDRRPAVAVGAAAHRALALGPAPVGVCVTSRAGTDIALVRLARRLAACRLCAECTARVDARLARDCVHRRSVH